MTSNPASVGPAPDGEWIEWSGGANPVPGAEVEFRIRVDQKIVPAPSNTLRWHHWGHRDDIIAYRIAPHPDPEAEPTGGVVEAVAKAINDRAGFTEYGPVIPEGLLIPIAEAAVAALDNWRRDGSASPAEAGSDGQAAKVLGSTGRPR